MKIVKYLLFLFIIVFIAGSVYVATKDGDYAVEGSRSIDAPPSLLYKELVNLENWKTWPAWTAGGSSLSLSDTVSGEGAEILWEGEEIRDGRILITEAIPYKGVEQLVLMQTIIGEAEAKLIWTFEPKDGETLVSWSLKGSQSFKEKLAFSLQENDMVDIFKPLLEKSLEDLEESTLRKMAEYSVHVDGVTEHGGGYYMYTTTAAKINEVSTKATEMIRQVELYMNKNNISISGPPMVIYNQRDQRSGTTIFSAAVPTPSQVITPDGSPVLNGFLEPQKVVKTTLRGNHTNAGEAWEKAYRYMEENGLEVNPLGQPFEIFITDSEQQENPASWVTEIYIPVL